MQRRQKIPGRRELGDMLETGEVKNEEKVGDGIMETGEVENGTSMEICSWLVSLIETTARCDNK